MTGPIRLIDAEGLPPGAGSRLVRDIRTISESLGDGVKKIYDGELAAMKKLRRVQGPADGASLSTELVGASS